jgi:DNA-binding GntR family transcriptional regulator
VTVLTTTYRPEFEAALRVFARVSEAMLRAGFEAPVLVDGAAVELYTASTLTTGDFDVVTGRQDAFEAALLEQGFVRPVAAWSHAGRMDPSLP